MVLSTRGPVPAAGNHLYSLDALRGVAALSVALGHVGWITSIGLSIFLRNVYLFVDFFFVLSGFVIALNYGHRLRNGAEIARFTWLRFWRLYPLHLTMLAVFVGIEVLKWIAARHYGLAANQPAFTVNGPRAFVTNLFLLQSFGLNTNDTFNAVSWSISTEFYAYLAFALVALLAGRHVAIAAAAVFAATGLLIWRDGGGLAHTWDILAFNRCLFGFFLGVLVYAAYARAGAVARLAPGPAAALCLAAIAAMLGFLVFVNNPSLGFLAPLLSAAVIYALASTPPNAVSRALSTRPMIWLGQTSYSIYMVHLAVFWAMAQILRVVLHMPTIDVPSRQTMMIVEREPLSDIAMIVSVAIVLVLAHFTYKWIELPFRDWSKTYWRTGTAAKAETV